MPNLAGIVSVTAAVYTFVVREILEFVTRVACGCEGASKIAWRAGHVMLYCPR